MTFSDALRTIIVKSETDRPMRRLSWNRGTPCWWLSHESGGLVERVGGSELGVHYTVGALAATDWEVGTVVRDIVVEWPSEEEG